MASKSFLEKGRIPNLYRDVNERKKDFSEVEMSPSESELTKQAERCMGCGIPFCHGAGCPLGNVIPEMNSAVAAGNWKDAWQILSSTSSFPEFTSRICPALCEASCTVGLNLEPVMIRQLEKAIVEKAFANGWVKPFTPSKSTGKKIAVIGSGPAGLAAADELARRGHSVTVYEKGRSFGGLLRYGIPDFKLDKKIIDRRIHLMEQSGIRFVHSTKIGHDVSPEYLMKRHDAVLIAVGSGEPRDLKIPGRELHNIHFALDFLVQQNEEVAGHVKKVSVSAKGKNVLVIGGGDTGSDCVGTSIRQGAKSVTQVEIMPEPPETRSDSTPWPLWPYLLRTSSSHKEGCERRWCIQSKAFVGDESGNVKGTKICTVKWVFDPKGKPLSFTEVPDSEEMIKTDLVLLAMGFTGIRSEGLLEPIGLKTDKRGTVQRKPVEKIFVTGDAASGPSLVVRAIADGKEVAVEIDKYLNE